MIPSQKPKTNNRGWTRIGEIIFVPGRVYEFWDGKLFVFLGFENHPTANSIVFGCKVLFADRMTTLWLQKFYMVLCREVKQ